MKIYIDIETIPTQNDELKSYVCENLKAPGNYKNEESIAKWLEENKGDAVNKTSLDGAFGEIVSIGVAINDEDPVVFYCDDWQAPNREVDILTRFNDYLREHASKSKEVPQFIGHNITKFDDRFIFQRSVINGVKPYYTATRQNTYDTMGWLRQYGITR